MTRKEELNKKVEEIFRCESFGYSVSKEDVLELLTENEREVWEKAAQIAETEGVYPELNRALGGPAWYQHGKRIAAKLRQQQDGL